MASGMAIDTTGVGSKAMVGSSALESLGQTEHDYISSDEDE